MNGYEFTIKVYGSIVCFEEAYYLKNLRYEKY